MFSEIRGPDFNTVFGATGGGGGGAPPVGGGAKTGVSLNQYTMGDILTPQAVGPHATVKEEPLNVKLTTDVDSSLALAAANLSMFATDARSPSDSWAGKPVW